MQFLYILGPCTSVWNHGSSSQCAKYMDRCTMVIGFFVDLHWVASRMDMEYGTSACMYLWFSVFFYMVAKTSSGFASASETLKLDEISMVGTLFHSCTHASITACHVTVMSTYNTPFSYTAAAYGAAPLLAFVCPSSVKRTVWFVFNAVVWAFVIGIPGLSFALWIPFDRYEAQKAIWVCARIYFRLLLWAADACICINTQDKLDPDANYIFACNHTSYFDIPILFYVLPYWLIFVSKRSVVHIPVIGWLVGLSGSILVQRSEPEASRLSSKYPCPNLCYAILCKLSLS